MQDEEITQLLVELKPYYVYKYCPECSKKPKTECLLKYNGLVLASYPPQYPHQCINCDKTFNLDQIYPSIIFEEINNDNNVQTDPCLFEKK